MASEQIFNGFGTVITSALTAGALTMTVRDVTINGQTLPTAGNFRAKISGTEIVLCTDRSGGVITITRGIEGTTAIAHPDNARIVFVVTAASFNAGIGMYNQANRRVFSIRDNNPDLEDGDDATTAIQEAFTDAEDYASSFQPEVEQPYITIRPVVKIPAGRFLLSASVVPGNALYDVESDGQTVLEYDGAAIAFDLTGVCYRNQIKNITFVGFPTAVKLSTTNLDTSRIEFDNCHFQNCDLDVDTVSFNASRSTNLVFTNCSSYGSKCFLKGYTDLLKSTGCRFDPRAHNDNLGYMRLDSMAEFTDCIFTPAGDAATYPNRRWFDLYASENTRRLTCVNCRFGGEAGGGHTILHNYAAGNYVYTSNNAEQVCISFDQCTLGTLNAPAGYRAVIRLFAMPNAISITNCGGSVVQDYIVVKDSSLTIPTPASYLRAFTIYIDEASRGLRNQFTGFSLVDPALINYVVGTRGQLDRFRPTFPDAANYEGWIASSAGTAGKRMVTIPSIYFDASRVIWGGDTFGFFVHINGGNADHFNAESNALCYVSFAIDNTGTKKAFITKVFDAPGGGSFANGVGTPTVFWGTNPTTGVDTIGWQAGSGTELSIMWDGTKGRAVITPMAGLQTLLSHTSAVNP